MSAIRKSETKTPLKCATSKNKTPEKIKKKLTERLSNKKGFGKKQSHVQVIETPAKYYKIIGKKATSLESLQYILHHWQVYNFIEYRSHYRTCIHVRKFQTFFF
jgi:hypothetical protein